MTKQTKNPAPGSTRAEMTSEEREWLRNFELHEKYGNAESLKKICGKPQVLNSVLQRRSDENNAKQKDVFGNQKLVHVNPDSDVSEGEAIDMLVQGDYTHADFEHTIEDVTLSPKIRVNRYTPQDYMKPGIPDEDGLIDAIDAERAREDAKKVKVLRRKK